MAITSSDILFKLSVKTGSAGDSTSGTQAGSLGKYVSTTQLSSTPLNNLFNDSDGTENAGGAGSTKYRCLFIHNNHATLTMVNTMVYMNTEVSGGASISLAPDNIAASAKGSSSAQAAEITDESTAPSGVGTYIFGVYGVANGISLGNIAAGQVRAFWIRRTASGGGAALDNDGVTLGVACDTAG